MKSSSTFAISVQLVLRLQYNELLQAVCYSCCLGPSPPAPAGPGKPVAGTTSASKDSQHSTSGFQDGQQQQQQWQPVTQQQQSAPDAQADAEPAAAWEGEEYPDEDEDDWGGYYDEQGNWVAYEEDYGDQQQQQQQEPSAMGAEDAVALLHSCYPTHPRALLQQLLQACDGDVQQAARILNDMDFEQRRARIAAAAAAGRAGTATGSSSSSRSSGPAGKKQQGFDYSLEQFPALGGPAPSTAPSSSGKQSNWAAVTSKPPAPAAAAGSKPSPASTTSSSTQRQDGGAAASAQQRSDAGAEVPWVETGAAVSQEYADARAEASDHARVRNACFQQATLAYMAGNKALAKELSAKGKAAAEAMWAAHERASSQIYTQRNMRLQQQQGRAASSASAAPVIDLHGLHVQEMMQLLPQQIAALQKQQHTSVNVIVGVGKHTKGPPAARMRPAVEALVRELGYAFTEPTPGLLKVRLR